jgi:hypothetical protein
MSDVPISHRFNGQKLRTEEHSSCFAWRSTKDFLYGIHARTEPASTDSGTTRCHITKLAVAQLENLLLRLLRLAVDTETASKTLEG